MRGSSITVAIKMACVAVVVGVAVPVRLGASAEVAGAVSIRRCSSAQVEIGPTTRGLGAALGHIGRWYRIHALPGGVCSLQGFPTVELLDRSYQPLPTHVKHGEGYIITATAPMRRVPINRRHDAYFALEYTDVPNDDHPCQAVRYLRITLPGDVMPMVIKSGGITPCPGEVGVSPIEARTSLR